MKKEEIKLLMGGATLVVSILKLVIQGRGKRGKN